MNFGIRKELFEVAEEIENTLQDDFKKVDNIIEKNQLKVLKAFQNNRLSEVHFNMTTGYGYDDIGREVIENIYTEIFNTEDSLVRIQFVNGTHALNVALTGILRPNDKMLAVTGKPYDTLDKTIEYLQQMGVQYDFIPLLNDGNIDYNSLKYQLCHHNIKLIHIQRSKGYEWRDSLSIEKIKELILFIKGFDNRINCVIDNCYGEFVELLEPTDVGVDLVIGSLIKNIGGGLAPMGAYISGKSGLVKLCADRLTAPGIGKECGATLGMNKSILMGLFMAPHIVGQAKKGAIFCSALLEKLGYEVLPKANDLRTDIIQAVKFNDKDKLIKFCKGIQMAAPIDSFVMPEPWDMPGYSNQVIMAAGCFIQGSSIEMTADAPIRQPYICYIQGGLTYAHAKISILKAVNEIWG